jgi:hypothetical protein
MRYFTVDEANALLPEIRPIMADLLERRARVAVARDQIKPVVADRWSNTGNATASALVGEFIVIEQLIDQLKAFGCEIKDINGGLLDFPARINDREVYLCWRYNEPTINYYHDLHSGFAGRKPL